MLNTITQKTHFEYSNSLHISISYDLVKVFSKRTATDYRMSVKLGDVSSNSFTSHLRSRRPVFAVMSRTGPTYNSAHRMCPLYTTAPAPSKHAEIKSQYSNEK